MVTMLLPEVAATVTILLFFVLTLFERLTAERARLFAISSSLCLIIAAALSLDQAALLFSAGYRVDSYSQLFKLLVAVGLFANATLGWPLRSIPRTQRTEYYLFFFSAGLGMMFLASVFNFLLLYLAMELVSYSLYIMVGMRRDRTEAVESTVKYFLIGAASSAVGLYGLSFIYGAVGGLGFGQLVTSLQAGTVIDGMVIAGIVLVFSSFLFKLAAFPFHVWAPDAYDGAASPVAMFLSSVSKLAGIAALFRIVYLCDPYLPRMDIALGIIAVLTMSYGNFVAFRQTSVKRLFAYSSIAQAGYIILGMIGHDQSAPQAVVYYSIVYLLMNLVLFMVTMELEAKVPDPAIDGFRGLYKRSALLALALMIALFSLAGVPPLAGFFGKWLLFSSAAQAGHIWLVAIAILNSVISLYYYLFLVKAAYFGSASDSYPVLPPRTLPRTAAFILSAAIALLGIYPLPLMDYLTSINLIAALTP
jgi:NADH-quinone oxidoreductase subunit N